MRNSIYFLAIISFFLNIIDMILTLIGLSLGAVEANPLLATEGASLFFAFKIIFPTLFIIVCLIINKKAEQQNDKLLMLITHSALMATILFWLAIVINNITVLSHLI